ncbi:T9SS type A sorting domain-containing protein [Flavobacterium noncentrifugens]|uniref:Por secretion system C-terminal sorting domain-containing protein n=2 Tax=Flavobacterium noncentrifugens TaxID=1128970 RepID=A0A1G8Y441_9FLAO|nr:T9SS type A sorting domain-containing protein [Flavobacterium noncentrifugens]SDJ97204.1 Por secretion system C-terminal sorting domain-containing protein [Flavobacterium noncentrifugens]
MKQLYPKFKSFATVSFILGILLQSYLGNAQTTLSAGDIIFTGYDSNPAPAAGDVYSIVLLTNISAGTTINFTDRGYFGSGVWQAAGSTEATVTWTSGTAIPLGTEIVIKGLSASVYNTGTGVLTANGTVTLREGTPANGLSLSNVGDQVTAFQGGTGIPESSGVTFISGLHYFYCNAGVGTTQTSWDAPACADGPNSSVLPSGLTGGTSAFYTGTVTGNTVATSGKFSGTGAPFSNAAAIRAGVMNQANWTLSNSATSLTMPSGATFIGSSPTITGNPPNRTICVGGNTTFAITASNATGYQWQLNSGSGFTNISNGAPYSGATTATLTITAATAGMSGYLYRCVATNSGSVNSNAGTLTVPNTIVTTTSQTNVSCKGSSNGSATLSASGGIGPYFYSWSPYGGTAATASGLSAQTYTVTVTDNISCTKTHTVTITEPANAVAVTPASQTNIACFGGSNGAAAINTPTGGTPGYTYNWTPGNPTGDGTTSVTGLTAGTWTCTVTDANGCTATQSFTVTQPTAFSVTAASQTNISCFGGSNGTASVTATGGTAGYTYSWSPSGGTAATASGLSAGTYTVTVTDANSCTATQLFTITQPATAVSGTTVITNIACNGGSNGSINLTPSGGSAPYTFNWGGGITTEDRTGLAAGSYSVTITDVNGCTGTVNATVTQPATAVSGTTVITNIACNGGSNGSINLTPSGGSAPYTFNWGGGITTEDRTGLAAGSYSVTITDVNGCTGTVNATVTQPATAVSATTVITNIACNGGSNGTINLTPSGGTAPYTFNWGGGITTEDRTGLAAGSYSVTITDANGCTGTVNAAVTQPSTLVVNPLSQTNIACFGGSGGEATVTASGGAGAYTYSWSPSGGTAATATGLTTGTYTVTVTDANSCTKTQSFTITQPATAVSGTTVITNIACNGGSNGTINLTPSGGTAPYTFNWGGGITTEDRTGLAAGSYSVTITDANGCTGTVNAAVTQPATAVSGTTVITNIACNGGSNGTINLTPSGGTAPYTFNWGGSITTEDRTGLAAGSYSVTITDANGCTGTVNATVTQPSVLVVNPLSQTNIACFGGFGGEATVTASGGAGAYTYSWSPSGGTAATATGLAAGTYTVTVTDANSCTATLSFTITQPDAITTTDAQTNVSCNGGTNGSASVTAIGGAGDYTYSWAPTGGTAATATGLTAGTYTVTVTDANSCTATRSFTITQPDAITTTDAQTNVSCNGGTNGSASVTAIGGAGSYTYSWSPSGGTAAMATGLTAGTYTVTVTDANSCTATRSFTITQPDAITTTDAQTNVSCNGGTNGSASVTAIGGAGDYTYSWAPTGGTAATATGLAAGTYTVTVTDANSCTATRSFTITQPDAITTTEAQTNVSCNGGTNGSASVTSVGGAGDYTYSWAPSGGTAATATGLAAGTYTVTVTDANSCTATLSFTITQPDAITATTSQIDILCNGAATGTASVTATGGTGAYTYSWSPSGGNAATATGLVAGTYNVTVTDANACAIVKTITITEAAPINLTLQPVAISVTEGANATFSIAASNATSYQWQVSIDGTSWTDVADGGTNPVYSGAATTTLTLTNVPETFDGYLYRVSVSNGSTCSVNSNSAELTVTPDLKMEDFSSIGVTIYPNPASSQVAIKIPEISTHSNCSVAVYDLNGRVIMQKRLTAESEKIDIAHLKSGVYIFNITSDRAKTTKRVVKY